MFQPKPVEELYDLEKDPEELHNLITSENAKDVVRSLSSKMKEHIVNSRDTGFMAEGQMMLDARNTTVYEMARQKSVDEATEILDAAELVGKISDLNKLDDYFSSKNASVRFWALNALDAFDGNIRSKEAVLIRALDDPSAPNRALAAEILINKLHAPKAAYDTLENLLEQPENDVIMLHAAVSARNLGPKAKPLVPKKEKEIFSNVAGDVWGRYKDWSYHMFTGMALDQTMANCGIPLDLRFSEY